MVAPAPALTTAHRRFLDECRTATLATRGSGSRPRLVPICYALASADDAVGRAVLYSPLDEKPKRVSDPHHLARVRDILVLPEVTLLVDRWDEDWSRLAWLRLSGTAQLLEPQPHEAAEHAAAVALLRDRYPQYRDQALESRPILRITIDRALGWGALE